MLERGPLFTMFSIIGFYVSLSLFLVVEEMELLDFGGLNLFS